MDDTEDTKPDEARERVPFRRRRRLHFHIGAWSIFTVGLVALFLTLLSMSLTGRAVTLPDWVARSVETKVNAALPEGSISLRQIEIGVTPAGRPRLRLVDVGLRDASGLDIAQLNRIEGGLWLNPLLRGDLIPRNAILAGAQITFRRLSDGSFALQFGQGNTATGNLADMLDAVDALFAEGMLAQAERVEAVGLTITLEDARTGRLWQVTDGSLEVTQSERLVEMEVRFDVFNQTEELAGVELSLRSDKETSAATFSVSFNNAAAADIGAQSPALSFLQLVDAPVSGALRTTLGNDGAITDLAGVLEIEQGAIKPAPGATPVGFGGAKGYVDFNPEDSSIALSGLSLSSELGQASIDGELILNDFVGGWPQEVMGQITLNDALLNNETLFDAPVAIERGFADVRLRFSPFSFDIGQVVLFHEGTRYRAAGHIGATKDAWDLALDITVPALDVAELKSVWPKTVSTTARKWVVERVESGELSEVKMALRGPSLEDAQMLLGGKLSDGVVKVLPTMPPARGAGGYLSLAERRLVVSVREGYFDAPGGGRADASGTSFTIPDVTIPPGDGIVDLKLSGPLRAGLALLNEPPVRALEGTGFTPDFASGRFTATGQARFPLLKDLPFEQVAFEAKGQLLEVASDELVPGSHLTADSLDFIANPELVEVSGPVRIGAVEARGTWHQPIGKSSQGVGSTVDGTITLNQALSDEFNLGLDDDMISGAAPAAFTLTLKPGQAPHLSARSDMNGLGLAIPGTGWTKARNTTGSLSVEASLGERPDVESIALSAPGLKANGTITTREDGGLDQVRLARVELGGWLDAPVTITGRGANPVAISVQGGRVDVREAEFGAGGSGPVGPKQPLSLALDELVVAQGIVLADFRGDFDLAGGLSGTFSGRVRGGGPIEGTVAQTEKGTAYRLTAKNGGRVLDGMGVFKQARGGRLEVVLAPTGTPGTFEGDMTLINARLVDAPAMAELLAAISIVGLIDQLDGQGISFSEVKARFRLSPERVTLYSSSAVSASLGLSMDGYYNLNDKTIDMQGVLSPFYLINSIGRVLSARDGEGLVGFSFTLTGPDDDMKVSVNPLSVLTPGFLREMFRRQAPTQPAEE